MLPGICQMPVIRYHPEWWTCITMDGFNSHVNVAEALQKSRDVKHHAVKEEGGSSHINQSYNQDVAKRTRHQQESCLIVAICNIPTSAWENLFKAVNLHPDH
eukprot:5460558-Ditylum_brightwellii.AAC.1